MSADVSVGGTAQGVGMTTTTMSACPTWCTVQDHSAEVGTEGPQDYLHQGPTFGEIITTELLPADGRGLMASVLEFDDVTAADLRQLGTDALAAAEWLEAQR